jgi:hypothetical protein
MKKILTVNIFHYNIIIILIHIGIGIPLWISSGEYINFDKINDEIQALLEEITELRQEILNLNQENYVLKLKSSGVISDDDLNLEILNIKNNNLSTKTTIELNTSNNELNNSTTRLTSTRITQPTVQPKPG